MDNPSDERKEIKDLIAKIRAAREETLASLTGVNEADFSVSTSMERWTDVRRVLLRFGEHMREHANQIEHTRDLIGATPTMPQRMLQEAERAYGQLLASLLDLSDDQLNQVPLDGGWSIRQVLEHALHGEKNYRAVIEAAFQAAKK